MSERAETILDAAERRIRDGGYNGFSFGDLAADVGVRTSTLHHHFRTKEVLATEVARRYIDRFELAVEAEEASGARRVQAWRRVFRQALLEDGRMCLCGILGAGIADLPQGVATQTKRFFERGLANLTSGSDDDRLSPEAARRTLATLEGAMLLARTLEDPATFDLATAEFA